MRKVIAILLLTIWIANFAGASIYFVVQLHRQKGQMRTLMSQLPKHELVKLSMTLSEISELQVEEHELKVNGQMFDIAFTEVSSGLINVYGLFDNDEDTILESLKSEASKQTNDGTVNQVLKNFFSLQFIQENFTLHHSFINTSKPQSHQVSIEVQCALHIDGPPPRQSRYA